MTSSASHLRDEIRRLERLREEEPGSLAFVRLAEAYRAAGEHGLALRVLEEESGRAPDHPAVHLVTARVNHDLGRTGMEREALERALAADPENAVARKALRRLAETEEPDPDDGSPDATDADGRRASHSPEERAEILEQLGGVAREDWWEEAGGSERTEPSPEADDEEEGPVTETMGRLYARQGLWEEAEAVYRELAERRPDDPRLARCLEEVREREVPTEPAGTDAGARRPARVEAGAPSGRESVGGTREEGRRREPVGTGASEPAGGEDGETRTAGESPTMRAHLRALLRGRGARPVRRLEDSGTGRAAAGRRTGGRPREEGERERSERDMEELLRRWQRAARRGRDG